MSIAIIAMTKQYVVVATDSRMTSENGYSQARKLYKYSDQIVVYGVGKSLIVELFFQMLDIIKAEHGNDFTYQDAVATLNRYKFDIENTPEVSELFAGIGICGIQNHRSISTTLSIGDMPAYENILTMPSQDENNEICFYILPPSNITNKQCDDMFISNCHHISPTITADALLKACTETIYQVSKLSAFVDSEVQYWVYDLQSGCSQSKLFESERKEVVAQKPPVPALYLDSHGHLQLK